MIQRRRAIAAVRRKVISRKIIKMLEKQRANIQNIGNMQVRRDHDSPRLTRKRWRKYNTRSMWILKNCCHVEREHARMQRVSN